LDDKFTFLRNAAPGAGATDDALQSLFMNVRLPPGLLVLVLSSTALGFRSSPQTTHQETRIPQYLNTQPGAKYIGSKACATCHADIYNEYFRTAMGRSMALPGNSSLALPRAPVKVYSYKLDRDYAMFRQGSQLYQSESQPASSGADVFHNTQRIAYEIGAGLEGIGYLVRQGNYLVEAPLSYYTRTHTWELSPGYENVDFGFDRVAPAACLACHSGLPQPVPGRPGLYEDPPIKRLAIGCERCHGPGQLHVEERMKGEPLKGPIDRSIVNPADLSGWLANNICMSCHESGDAQVLLPGKTYLDFRPGEPLDRTVAIFAVPFTPQSPPLTPLLQQYVQMVLSKCYIATGGKLECITCHDPHFEPTAAQAPAYYRQKCVACHSLQSCTSPMAARMATSPPDNCIACHMPRQKLQTISHAALTNHRIIAHSGEPFPQGAFHMTTPDLPDLVFLDKEPGKEGPDPLVILQVYEDLRPENRDYQAPEQRLLDRLAKTEPNNPAVLSALAQMSLLDRKFSEAQEDMSRTIAAGSTKSSDLDLYGRLLIQSGQMAQAVTVLNRDIALHPYSTQRYMMLALAYIKLQDYHHALETVERELELFPQDSAMRAFFERVRASFSASPQ
jgi:hypothetical protein